MSTYIKGDEFATKDAPGPNEAQCAWMWDADGSVGWSCAYGVSVAHADHVATEERIKPATRKKIRVVVSTSFGNGAYLVVAG